MGIMFWQIVIIWLILGIIFAITAAVIAFDKNRNVAGWSAIGLILGIFGIVIIAVIKPLEPSSESRTQENAKRNRSGRAVAALVFGAISLVAWLIPLYGAIFSIIGLYLGSVSIKSRKRGMAMTGVALCGIGLLLTIINASIGAYQWGTGTHALLQ